MEVSSWTAEAMAAQRALENLEPSDRRLFEDPTAETFLSGRLRALLRLRRTPLIGRLAPWLYDRIAGSGPRASAVARTRFIDDAIASSVAGGLKQIVILGAGFDTRANRLDALQGTTVFEVDHPATQARKRRLLAAETAQLDRVSAVSLDFERDDLVANIRQAGHRADEPTLHIWEGVTNYLTAMAIDQTFAQLRVLSSPGSELIFTYVDRRAIDGTDPKLFPEAARWTASVRRAGEPWIFGLLPEQVEVFVEERGFEFRDDHSTAALGEQYFPPRHRRDVASALYHVVRSRRAEALCPG